ncbi:DUF4190 domain-containing protein [Amnibacterium flavum]|uniref:DUF4190 domain-containing protein n=2 Tax=Amnibacterium flavum TaxID=2173173 RepID=A0A2V1HPP6_9MICO|nr:DUF4190 domain-containing protein [Amnibacterium flavum]PVZ93582.1 hypothetical protein DDQ50_14830 [Amnibacterium flavum]
MPPGPQPPAAVEVTRRPGSAAAITALVLGIVAVVVGALPFVSPVAYVIAIAGVVFAIVALVSRTHRKGMAITGLILSVLSVIVATVLVFVTIQLVGSIRRDIEESGGVDTFLDEIEESAGPLLLPVGGAASGVGNGEMAATPVDGVGGYGIAEIIARGDGHITITGLDSSGTEVEPILDEDLPYSGQLLYNLYSDSEVASFEILTNGEWDIQLQSTMIVPELRADSAYAGTGDKVIWYEGPATTATLEAGPGGGWGAVVWSTGSSEESLCDITNEESCRFDLAGGGEFMQIYSYDSWDIAVGTRAGAGATDVT